MSEVKRLISKSILDDTADAIREKTGSSAQMTPSQFAANISSISTAVQSDWDQTDSSADDYIKNKPTELSDFTDNLGTDPVHTHSQYQLIIDDLAVIRSGAGKGATAVQDANYVHTDNNYDGVAKDKVDTLGTAAFKNTGTLAGNVPVLDSNGKLNTSTLPALAISETFTAANSTAMLALAAQVGDVCIRTDETKTYILVNTPASELTNWKLLEHPADAVSSVNNKTGAVTLTYSDVGAVADNDARLSDPRTPTSHTHGEITNDGKLGTASRIVVTDSSKNIGVGSIDPANLVVTTDSRLSDARTPTSHNHGNITNNGKINTTVVTSATGVLVYDSNNDIQRTTVANAKSILSIPSVDQTYNASSSNAQSGTAVTQAIANKADSNTVYTKQETDTAISTAINNAILTALNSDY